MKIGASTLAGIEFELEKTLDFIENLGIEYAELVHQYPAEFIDSEILESYSLKYSIHAPFMDVNIASPQDQSRLNSIAQIKSSIDLANEINAEAVVVHPGLISFLANKYFKKEVYEFANQSIKEIGDYAKNLGVMATIENMPNFESMIYQNIADLNQLLVENEMHMTLDIGHANHVGYAPDEMIFDSIKHIHVHDNLGDDDSHLPLGEGSIDLKYIINTLESKNYDGIYILEVNDYDSIKKSYEYMKKNF
ncbi:MULTISPECIES: sugar phosphate isomerase/epimerase family protein [unclassified Methanobrevibacter]|uniref:sugar phosphate isomerase/epimerase family protein n=1 Tax=unclassified Methanobrevibacter TaxID=2638681 RepID=UPI0025E73713|nr:MULTISPECIES: sugar phosphate isomerase/epimerase [unclassified Methanobrevibacter]MEE0941896.1 sugar phosphate isomerase/epimerase [Methanobrevibacter sp.]